MRGARSADIVEELAGDVRDRLTALARAHALTLPGHLDPEAGAQRPASLHALVRAIVAPFDTDPADGGGRVHLTGADTPIAPGPPVTSMALLLHEFVTNAAKYGALSSDTGRVEIHCEETDEQVVLVWSESGGPPVQGSGDAGGEGFGSLLVRAAVRDRKSTRLNSSN